MFFLRRCSRLGLRGRRRSWHDVATPGRLGDADPPSHTPLLLRVYARALHRRPLSSAVLTSAGAAAAGDLLAQGAYTIGMDSTSGRRGST